MKNFFYISLLLLAFSCEKKNVTENVSENVTENYAQEVTNLEANKSDLTGTVSEPTTAPQGESSYLSGSKSSLTGTRSDLHMEINLSADVLFDFDKSVLKPSADPELQRAADVLIKNSQKAITITGHTDAKGSDSYNEKLSLARAEAVKNWFLSHGVDKDFQTVGLGAKKPIAPNANPDGSDNPEGRAKNRRVELVVSGSQSISK